MTRFPVFAAAALAAGGIAAAPAAANVAVDCPASVVHLTGWPGGELENLTITVDDVVVYSGPYTFPAPDATVSVPAGGRVTVSANRPGGRVYTAAGDCAAPVAPPAPPETAPPSSVPPPVVVTSPPPAPAPRPRVRITGGPDRPPARATLVKTLPRRTFPDRVYRARIVVRNTGAVPARFEIIDPLPRGMVGFTKAGELGARVIGRVVVLRPGGSYTWRPRFRMTPWAAYRWVCNTARVEIGTRELDRDRACTFDPPRPS